MKMLSFSVDKRIHAYQKIFEKSNDSIKFKGRKPSEGRYHSEYVTSSLLDARRTRANFQYASVSPRLLKLDREAGNFYVCCPSAGH